MYQLIKDLFSLLDKSQKCRFYSLQLLVVVMAFTELLGIASIAPFMSVVSNPEIMDQGGLISNLADYFQIYSHRELVIALGVSVLVFLLVSTLISMFTTWKLSLFATSVGTELADDLYSLYMKKGWLFHTQNSSTELTKKIVNETDRVTSVILTPLMHLNSRIILVIVLGISIFVFNPEVAIFVLLIFGIAYVFLFFIVRKRLSLNGSVISKSYSQRYKLINEGFGGIKDILLLNLMETMNSRFKVSGKRLAYSLGTNNTVALVPRYAMEFIAFGLMIGLVLYFTVADKAEISVILPVLALYALAGFKLLPALQQIYANTAQIKGSLAAFESIKDDLYEARTLDLFEAGESNLNSSSQLVFAKSLKLERVFFKYPSKKEYALSDINIDIPVNQIIGFVGPSGSGKSTLIDLVLGLIPPKKGTMFVDDVKIDLSNIKSWQKKIGYVPQQIFLTEGSIAENVAFGVESNEINLHQVRRAIELAHLGELVKSAENGLDTFVGERGVQLSGGQRQRVGIARALYHDPEVIIFDEATSALDGITEKIIMDAIHYFGGDKTILMIAHRLQTVQECDLIYFIEAGQVVDKGTYQELYDNNSTFRKMANHG